MSPAAQSQLVCAASALLSPVSYDSRAATLGAEDEFGSKVYPSHSLASRLDQGNHVIGDEPGERTMQIRSAILDVQYGRADDMHGWMRRVV